MNLELGDCTFAGPALPEPFVRGELSEHLARHGLLPTGSVTTERAWGALRSQLRALGNAGGPLRVHNHVLVPLAVPLGFDTPRRQDDVATRAGLEDGGWLMQSPDGTCLRAWTVGADSDLDAPHRAGRAYRFSPTRSAQRVLRAGNEIAGLLTNGQELRLLLCDASRSDSHIAISLAGTGGWRDQTTTPDSFRLLLALAAPRGLAALPELLDAGRLSQVRITKDLRVQARHAVEGFLQAVLDHPANAPALRAYAGLAAKLWEEALILVYRLLFIFKLESAAGSGGAFSFAATTLWRGMLSPNRALGPLVRRHLDQGHDTGRMLEDGLRTAFRAFRDGLSCSEICIAPLGGALFGACAMPLLENLTWGDRAVALLLDRLLWTRLRGGAQARVQYGPLDIEDLGHIYEALLELEPGISTIPMLRLRRAKLEVVVPAGTAAPADVRPVETIPPGRFYLRAGLGRKATGSYYTPHAFVRYLVQETLAPQLQRCSPDDDPRPAAILALKVVDPAAGSGHFLVEACRFLGEALYAACRLCDERAEWRERLTALPDPDATLLAYLPSRASDGGDSGLSRDRALAICRRMVAVHCLYGVDRNRLAVELAKLSLWLESYADGLPLTFLDHRLVVGDSLGGAFFAQLASLPVGGSVLDPLLARGVMARLSESMTAAMTDLRTLESGIGRDTAEHALKEAAKTRMDAALAPLRQLARAWSGAVMLGMREGDDEFLALAGAVAASGACPAILTPRQCMLLDAGASALPWDLTFPEVFRPDASGARTGGFDAVFCNPPWDIVQQNAKEFLAGFDLSILDAPSKREASVIQRRLLRNPSVAGQFRCYQQAFEQQHRLAGRLYAHQTVAVSGASTAGKLDAFRIFAERNIQLAGADGGIGMVVPSSFHANEGATGIRRLYFHATRIDCCFSFENRRHLFDIHERVKFALVVARRPGPTRDVHVGFYLNDLAQLDDPARIMRYDLKFIAASGGEHLTFLELRSTADHAIASHMFLRHPSLRDWTRARGIVLGREVNITDDAHRVIPAGHPRARTQCLLLHEGKTIHHFDDRWDASPRYAVPLTALDDKPAWRDAARFFRLGLRRIARSTDERTAIAAFTSPGYLFDITVQCERSPQTRPNAAALQLCAILNSHVFDWALRQKTAVTVNLFILEACPACELSDSAARFLAHAALRLSCNHAAYAPLWQEQLGGAWRETSSRFVWPAVGAKPERQRLRAAMDAVVADAYRLGDADYRRILASFRNQDEAALCGAAFAELTSGSADAFMRRNDPYYDIPLPTSLATPMPALGEPIPLRRAS